MSETTKCADDCMYCLGEVCWAHGAGECRCDAPGRHPPAARPGGEGTPLLPCPFCGGRAEIEVAERYAFVYCANVHGGCRMSPQTACGLDAADATAIWNARPAAVSAPAGDATLAELIANTSDEEAIARFADAMQNAECDNEAHDVVAPYHVAYRVMLLAMDHPSRDTAPHSPAPAGEATRPRARTLDGGLPTRQCMDLWSSGERAIAAATNAVEAMGADVRLTDAVVLLGKARDAVADYVEDVPRSSAPASGAPDEDVRDKYERLRRAVNESTDEHEPGCSTYGHTETCPACDPARWLEDQQREIDALRTRLAASERAGEAWAKQATENAMDVLRMNWLEAAGGKYDLTCWNVDWPSKNNGWAIGGDDEIDDVAKGATAREALDAAIAAHPEVLATLTPTGSAPSPEERANGE